MLRELRSDLYAIWAGGHSGKDIKLPDANETETCFHSVSCHLKIHEYYTESLQ